VAPSKEFRATSSPGSRRYGKPDGIDFVVDSKISSFPQNPPQEPMWYFATLFGRRRRAAFQRAARKRVWDEGRNALRLLRPYNDTGDLIVVAQSFSEIHRGLDLGPGPRIALRATVVRRCQVQILQQAGAGGRSCQSTPGRSHSVPGRSSQSFSQSRSTFNWRSK
jgi:hypothetical protein